ncbi:Gfo/Idh/MocA family protein [Leifsonia sp. 22587]|uniref:Gfo/Idh/MocA family protein n=1 Tax=Leifsonia sp. 22587 TaxID=3453946 RepID=UPI003F8482C3
MTRPGKIARVGLVGAGRIGGLHASAIRAAGAEIAGVVSSTPRRSTEAAERLGIPTAYPSLTEMLFDDSIQAVHITSPNSLHAGQVSQVIAAGRHIVSEKPFTTSRSDAETLVAAAKAAGVVGTVAFTYRYHPLAREARARVIAGEVGSVLTVQAGYVQDWLLAAPETEWRLDTNLVGPSRAFADVGSHVTDLLEFVSQRRISRLAAVDRSVLPAPGDSVDDAVALAVELDNGAIGTILVSQVTAGRGQALTLEVSGDLAGIALDQENPTVLWKGAAGSSRREPLTLVSEDLSASAQQLGFTPTGTLEDYFHSFNAFVRDSYAAMAGEQVDALPTLEDGLRAVRIGDAVRRSARASQWVQV